MKKEINKYLSIFKISFQQEFVYRLNFVMWRLRNVLQVFLTFFLWDVVFGNSGRVVFGYDRAKILTYVFGLMVVKSIVTASRSIDVAGEISEGKLTNYLLKPVGYIKYWFVRDLSSKALNLIFAIGEFTLLYFILKPSLFLQTNIIYLLSFLAALTLAVILYFLLLFIFDCFPFLAPENAWGPLFLLMIFVEFFAGGIFPLDILPLYIQRIIFATPFPYLIFMPIQIYLGKVSETAALGSLLAGLSWTIVLGFLLRVIWLKGLRTYRAEGR